MKWPSKRGVSLKAGTCTCTLVLCSVIPENIHVPHPLFPLTEEIRNYRVRKRGGGGGGPQSSKNLTLSIEVRVG